MRTFRIPLALAVLFATALPAQTVRWNDVADALGGESEPPAISLWLERSIVPWGGAVRVNFEVQEEAYVVVARVDYTGALTVLYPTNKNRMYPVKPGITQTVRSARLGTLASFRANERPGSTGYVFAIATREPMNLSRLSNRDFSSWVTGVSRSRPMVSYIGDPYRVIQRFSRLVLWEDAPFEYDIQFYSVDQPQFAYSSFSGMCALGYNPWGRLGYEYDDSGYSSGGRAMECGAFNTCFAPSLIQGVWLPFGVFPGLCRGYAGYRVASSDPVPPPFIPDQKGGPINPWAPDSIQRPNVGVQTGGIDKQDAPSRPAPVATGESDDLSFTIPARALRGFRDRELPAAPGAPRGESGPIPMPARPVPTVADRTPIDWVRPPRALERPDRAYDVNQLPTRFGSRSRDDMPSRASGGTRSFDPPPRSGSPMWDREGGVDWNPPVRNYGGFNSGSVNGGSMYNPPSSFEGGRPMTNPGLSTSGSGSSSGTTTSSPSTSGGSSTSGGAKGSASSEERRPHQ